MVDEAIKNLIYSIGISEPEKFISELEECDKESKKILDKAIADVQARYKDN
ncbi:MAG: hypothetical protein M1479_00125 [Actinobacteria bacterium]|nr:hypothetical protein [Actinomycetota bacterium]